LADQPKSRKRRWLIGAAIAAPVALVVAEKPRAHAGAHDDYFRGLQAALKKAELMRPTLVIDKAALDHNLACLKSHLPKNKAYRVVAKSLPSLGLLAYIRAATGSTRLMVFHQPDLNLLAREMPDAHMLLGKPMPVQTVHRFFENHVANTFDVSKGIDWLVDTPARIAEYRELAKSGSAGPMRLNLELDVGLHRGGFKTTQDVAEALRAIDGDEHVAFAGFMGYEAHASKMPGILGGPRKALDQAMAYYAECVNTAREVLGAKFDERTLTLNMGGSSTYELYDESSPCNELSMGSGLMMPTDFDKPTLADHKPASFIATPVLKALDRTDLPGLEGLTGAFRAWDPNTARAFYIYGGYWLADVVSPPGLQRNAIWGHSTNQDLLTGSTQVQFGVGDCVFYRPHQSEFVFLQFGDLALYDNGEITQRWPVFTPAA
jgi:D-serine deaminase-like pyridoxal phosphate-dependent protein